MAEANTTGKKIFFFYPPTWLKEEMIGELVENEYESYAIDDHRLLFPLLKNSDGSIAFINIDGGPEEGEWEKYIRVINGSDFKNRVQIGILSNNNTKNVIEKYIGELKAEAGYIILRQRTQDVKKAIYNLLVKLDARGRRRYLRASCSDSGKATFNIQYKTVSCGGKILDISSVGMACYFDDERLTLNVGDNLPDIQLRLLGKITTVSGRIAGIRQDMHKIYVVIFDEKALTASREKIHSFISYSLESNMQKLMKELLPAQRS